MVRILLLGLMCIICVQEKSIAQVKSAQGYINDLRNVNTPGDSADRYAWASMALQQESNMDMAIPYARRAIALASKSANSSQLATAYYSIADAFIARGQNDSGKFYSEKVIESYDKANEKGRYYTYALNLIAAYYLRKGDADMALHYGHDQLEAAIEIRDTVSISNSYTMLSAIYDMMDDEDRGLIYAKKALEFNILTGNTFNRATVLANTGLAYINVDSPEVALSYLRDCIYYSTEVYPSKWNEALGYMLTGECFNKIGSYDSALYYLDRAEHNIEEMNMPKVNVELWYLYASAYGSTGKNREGIAYLDKAIPVAKENGLIKLYSKCAVLYADMSSATEDYESAYKYLRASVAIEDSLSGVEVQETINRLREEYLSDKKDQRIAQEEQRSNILGMALLVGLSLTALILVQYIRQRRANRTIHRQSDKLTLLMKELHHRVKNNLQIISSLLSLQSFRIKDATASRAVREGQQRIEAMSLIHQRLYTKENVTEINIREFVTDLIDSLQSAYGYGRDDISVNMEIDNELMNVDHAIPLSLIINELVTNAFKYAYQDNDHPELSISLRKQGDKLKLIVADNGKGVNPEEWQSKQGSFGKELIQTFVKQLNGHLSLLVNNGTRFTLTIPYNAQ